jgi:RNA polymerase sigma-70 factor (ECF subfamily)
MQHTARRRSQTNERDEAAEHELIELVHRTVNGDRVAFAALHEHTAGQVFRTARRMLRSTEDAEEIVGDVFTFVWQQAQAYDVHRGSVRAWLTIIARNRSIDRLRQRHSARSLDAERRDPLTTSLVYAGHGPDQLLARLQTRSAVDRALKSLSGLRRQLVELSFFEELSHEEIARSICVPLGTVKSHVRRALASMRRDLAVHDTAHRILKKRPPHA